MRQDANLIATRGDAPVRRWIVAHLDTKAQGQSMAGRVVGAVVVALAVLALTALAVARLWGPLDSDTVAWAAVLALVACGLAARGGLRGTTVGARDNGSGLLAALVAAEAAAGAGVGVLITGAEEFGLVGARVFAREYGPQLVGRRGHQPRHPRRPGDAVRRVPRRAGRAAGGRGVAAALGGVAPEVRRRGQPLVGVRGQPAALAHRRGRAHGRAARLGHPPADAHARATRRRDSSSGPPKRWAELVAAPI